MYKILIVDDQLLYAQSLKMAMQADSEIQDIAIATSAEQAIDLLAKDDFDLCLTDIAMPEKSGLELYSEILINYPKVKVLAISGLIHNQAFAMLWQEGIHGMMHKSEDLAELMHAIKQLSLGKRYLSKKIAKSMQDDHSLLLYERLTEREKQVLRLLVDGFTTEKISNKLSISMKTARNHRDRVMEKTDCHTAIELVLFCVRAGLISSAVS